MTGYGLVNLKDMIQELGEGRTKEILSEFSCPLNKDVEFFLHCKAIEFARQGIAQTQLVVTSYKDKPVLVGYFTLSNKVLEIPRKNISKNVAKKVNRFAMARDARRSMTDNYMISAPLIGQLGKNFANGYDNLIPGDVLLKLATDKVRDPGGAGRQVCVSGMRGQRRAAQFLRRQWLCDLRQTGS